MKVRKIIEIDMEYCGICGYEWQPRHNKKPKSCPKCKRYDWAKKQKEKIWVK